MDCSSNILSLILIITVYHVFGQASAEFNCRIPDGIQEYKYDFQPLSKSDISISEETEKETIWLRLCSPLQRKCRGRDGYSVCLTKDGKEIGLGKSPFVLKNVENTLHVFFTGDRCRNDKNYTVIIIMKCDYSVTGTSSPQIFSQGEDGCVMHMIWKTDQACIPRKEVNCTIVDQYNNFYNLSSLTATSDNHFVNLDKQGKLKMIINVCHTIIHEYEATCKSAVGACLRNATNATNVIYESYGQVANNLSIVNDTLQINYTDGNMCTSMLGKDDQHTTTIYFFCDPEAIVDTTPQFMNESEPCYYKFSWKTAAACNRTYLQQYRMATDSICTVVNPDTKFKYNLRSLMKQDFVANASNGSLYKFRICSSLVDVGCTPGTGICETKNLTSAGTANTNLMWRHGGPYLNYTDGGTCGNGQRRHTFIAFVCGAEGSKNLPVVVKDEPCSLIIHWYTDLACEERILCATVNNDTNLLPLISSSKNYVVKALGTEIHINICRPIVPSPGLACEHGSAACQVVRNSKDQYTKETSLGFPDHNPVLDGDQNIILNYYGGSPCPESPLKNISSSIKFVCGFNGDAGLPEFKNYSNCQYIFEWKTNIVCSALVEKWVPPCTIKNSSHSNALDLSVLYKNPSPRIVTSKGKNYSISICGGKAHCNGSAVCLGNTGYGTSPNVVYDYRSNMIKLRYSNGAKCGTESYASELSLICNTSIEIGDPSLILDTDCSASFEWHTSIACAGVAKSLTSDDPVSTTETTMPDPPKNYGATQTWIVTVTLILVMLVIGVWMYMRNPRRCGHLRSRIGAITATRNHSRVQYSRVNTTEEARLLLDTSDPSADGQIDSDDELLGV